MPSRNVAGSDAPPSIAIVRQGIAAALIRFAGRGADLGTMCNRGLKVSMSSSLWPERIND
jgi:hypothetical protein